MEETGQCNAEHFEMRIVFKYSLQLVLFFPDNKIRYYSATCLVNWPVTVHVYISIIFYLEYFLLERQPFYITKYMLLPSSQSKSFAVSGFLFVSDLY